MAGAAAACMALAACSHGKDTAKADAPAQQTASAQPASSGGFVSGGALGAMSSAQAPPAPSSQSAPDINTVPTKVPAPTTTKEAREETTKGLVADRINARYTDQSGRTQPVVVRPLVDTPDALKDLADKTAAAPPVRPEEQQTAAVAPVATPTVESDVGPRAPGAVPRRSADAATPTVTGSALAGYRSLAELPTSRFNQSSLTGTLTITNNSLTPADRKILNTAARVQIDARGRGVLRVVGHGTGGAERAVMAAKELERLGVSHANIFVGADNIQGPTEVFLDREK